MRISYSPTIAAFGQTFKEPESKGTGPAAAKAISNLYVDVLMAIPPAFKASKPANPTIFESGNDKGTKQYRMADAVLGFGKTGGLITGVSVVRRVYPEGHAKHGKPEFLCQWPSRAVGPIRHAILDVSESGGAKEMLDLCGKQIVAAWATWQKARVASGVATAQTVAATGSSAVVFDDSMLADLGIDLTK